MAHVIWLLSDSLTSSSVAFFLFIPSVARAEQWDVCASLYALEAALDGQYGMSLWRLWFYQLPRLCRECQVSAMTFFHYCRQLIYVSLVLQLLMCTAYATISCMIKGAYTRRKRSLYFAHKSQYFALGCRPALVWLSPFPPPWVLRNHFSIELC